MSIDCSVYCQVVTYDASPDAGAAENCRNNTHRLFKLLLSGGDGAPFRKQVAQAFALCGVPESAADLEKVAYWVQGFYDAAAMGNYPYPSEYMGGALPAWPMRAACKLLAAEDPSDVEMLQVGLCGRHIDTRISPRRTHNRQHSACRQ